jgi:NADH:ubiquinone oxidoreductase subunit H
VVTVVMLMGVAYTVLLERKLVGRIQNRWGPSRVGPFGLLQPLVDGAKSFLKEDLIPPASIAALSARAHHLAGLRAHLHRRGSLWRARHGPARLRSL